MEKDLTIEKLKESLEKNYGDYGRTQYIIEKLQKELPFPKSDHLYIERMIKLCEPVIEEPEETSEVVYPSNLIKCYRCDLHIKLDEKSIRKNFWFHDRCFEKIPIVKTQVSQKISVPLKVIRKPIKIESKPTYPQMIFSGGLLTSLVGITYFVAGDLITAMVGIWGSILYVGVFESNIFPKKKQKASVVKTGSV